MHDIIVYIILCFQPAKTILNHPLSCIRGYVLMSSRLKKRVQQSEENLFVLSFLPLSSYSKENSRLLLEALYRYSRLLLKALYRYEPHH